MTANGTETMSHAARKIEPLPREEFLSNLDVAVKNLRRSIDDPIGDAKRILGEEEYEKLLREFRDSKLRREKTDKNIKIFLKLFIFVAFFSTTLLILQWLRS